MRNVLLFDVCSVGAEPNCADHTLISSRGLFVSCWYYCVIPFCKSNINTFFFIYYYFATWQSDAGRLCRSGDPRRAPRPAGLTCHLPFAPAVIWAEQLVQEMCERCGRCFFLFSFFLRVGFLSDFIAATFFFYAHAIFPLSVRFYAQRDGPNWGIGNGVKRTKGKGREHRGPSAGWGSSLCCWSGCHVAPCGDDCAIYCLAGAGDLRQRSGTRSALRTELTVCKPNTLAVSMWHRWA